VSNAKCVCLLFFSLTLVRGGESAETGYLGGTVSVEELRNPLTGKALKLILAAQNDLQSSQHERGMETLQRALDDPQTLPYAVSMLAVEHLKARQMDAALPELEEAVRLLPGRAENHSNLAFALGLTGQIQRGLLEIRRALQLDPARPKAHLVMGLLLLHAGSTKEALVHLNMAAEDVPSAHLVLADYYGRTGEVEAAEREREQFRAPAK